MEEIQDIEQSGSVPRALNYSDVMQAGQPTGDLQTVCVLPNNGSSYNPQSTVNFAVNVPVNSFADMSRAYFKFKINNTGGVNEFFLDKSAGGAGIWDSVKIISPTGGTLSEIHHYNALTAMLADYTNPGHVDGFLNVAEGTSSKPLALIPVGTGKVAADVPGTTATRVAVEHSTSISVCHVPHGGMFNCDRYLPLGFINGQLQIQIQLASLGGGVWTEKAKPTTWTSDSWELHIPIVRTPEDFNTNLRQLMASGVNLSIHMKDWANQQATIASGTVGQTNVLLANRKRSVDAVFACLRRSDQLANTEVETAAARRTCGVTSYQYSIAGVEMPSKPVTGGATDLSEYMINTQMALKKLGYDTSSSTATRANYYNGADTTEGSLVVYALDLEAYRGVLSGKNLSSAMPLIFKPTLLDDSAKNVAKTQAVVADVFSHFDSILTLSGVTGALTVSS